MVISCLAEQTASQGDYAPPCRSPLAPLSLLSEKYIAAAILRRDPARVHLVRVVSFPPRYQWFRIVLGVNSADRARRIKPPNLPYCGSSLCVHDN